MRSKEFVCYQIRSDTYIHTRENDVHFYIIVLYSTLIYSIELSLQTIDGCHLLIVGGLTAALEALLSSSKLLDRRVYSLKPTDWVGRQLIIELHLSVV